MNRIMHASAKDGDEGFGLVEVILAIFILGLVSIVMIPVLITGMTVAATQATVASGTRLLNQTIEEVRIIAVDPTIACSDVEITRAVTDGRGVELEATSTVLANTHRGPNDASGNPTIVKSGLCDAFAAPGSLTVEVVVTRTDTGAELASATTIVSVLTPPEEAP